MGPYGKYSRITNDEPKEDEQGLLVLSQPVTRIQTEVSKKYPSPWTADCIVRLVFLFILLMVAFGFVIHNLPDPRFHSHDCHEQAKEHHTIFHKAAVAAGQQECSEVGAEVLKEGGNAVDSAIATLLCQGVVEPYFSGIGGGFAMVIYNQTTKKTICIDAREMAPNASSEDMYLHVKGAVQGPNSIGVPGELKGMDYAYKKYGGKVSWHRLFEPAINKARNGFQVSGAMAIRLSSNEEKILSDEVLCSVYCDPTRKRVKEEGEIVMNTNLADTLSKIQELGVDEFYNGEMTKTMVKEINDRQGIMTLQDFQNYHVIQREPVVVPLDNAGYTIHAPPLPFGGPIFSAIMTIMDLFNVTTEEYEHNKTLQWHRTVEAFRHSYGYRYKMGDPSFVTHAYEIVDYISTGQFARSVKPKIFDDKTFHDPEYYGAVFYNSGKTSTSHMSVLDPDNNCVAVTSTINRHFGSLVMSPSHGVLFNNEMEDFSFQKSDSRIPTHLSAANLIRPGKRPLSSMSPVIFFKDNEPVFIIGAAGGIHIPTAVSQIMLRLLYFGSDDFDEPIQAKRLHDTLIPDKIEFESGYDKGIIEGLKAIGHHASESLMVTEVNGIKNHKSHIHAFSDLRNKGAGPAGW